MSKLTPFHVAIPVFDLEKSRKFYVDLLGCKEGRSTDRWIDFDLYGHQFVVHLNAKTDTKSLRTHSQVDGYSVPVPHYGVVLDWDEWHMLEKRLKNNNVFFLIEPYIRFKGLPGEQATMFFLDPSDNALEFKSFKDLGQLFAI